MQDENVSVLIVDDQPSNLVALQAVLAAMDLNIAEANSGQEALSLLDQEEFALVLLDVQMPGMDGFETAKLIRANPKTRTLPIIFLTASIELHERIYKGYEAGAVDYMFKPFDPQILRSKVKVFVDLYLARQEIERQARLLYQSASSEQELFLNYALDGVVGMDASGKVNYWNNQAENIFGWKRDEVLGQLLSGLIIPKRYRLAHENGLKKFLMTGNGPILRKRITIEALRKNGDEFLAELTVSPIRSEGRLTFSAFIRDNTEKIRLERQQQEESSKLKISEEKLRTALKSRDEFISICSHELKTPVTSMKLQSQLALKQIEKNDPKVYEPEAVHRRVRTANEQLDRMTKLIDDMLNVSKISNGTLQIRREPVNVSRMVSNLVAGLSEQFQQNRVKLNLSIQEPGLMVLGDEFRLEQVMTNLITNALKYGEGRPVSIEVSSTSDDVLITVRDQGMGIEPEHQSRIFQKFERAVDASNISGLGLGLYISHQFVLAHKGNITVESAHGIGSTFIIRLPRLEMALKSSGQAEVSYDFQSKRHQSKKNPSGQSSESHS